jgi:imidazolonepropionase
MMPAGESLLLTNIGELVTNQDEPAGGQVVGRLGLRHDAAVVVADGRVAWVGPRIGAPAADAALDCASAAVIPGFVDSHTHLVFAGDRAGEFAARMSGQPYRAGGIQATVAATRAASSEHLRAGLGRLVAELTRGGTTTFEVKSGYGLTVADEARLVELAGEVTEEVTFLGAHVCPPELDPADYLDLVTGPMLSACAAGSRWVDVFCERGAFGERATRAVLLAGLRAGLGPRVHANQLGPGPGVRLGVELGAASVDHCTFLDAGDIAALGAAAPGWWPGATPPAPTDPRGGTVATLLPGAEFATRSAYPDARALLAGGAVLALASDCNPGTSYTTSMALCIALAVREMRLSPAEAVWAATAGGAIALRRADVGRVAVGAAADLVVLAAPSHIHLAYRPGVDLVAAVVQSGRMTLLRPGLLG